MASSSRASVSSAVAVGEQSLRHLARGVRRNALGLVDQSQLRDLLLGDLVQLALLDLKLIGIEFARALHRQPLAQRHRKRAGQQPGDAGQQDRLGPHAGARHAHHQAEDRDQAVVGAQDAGAQRVAAAARCRPSKRATVLPSMPRLVRAR